MYYDYFGLNIIGKALNDLPQLTKTLFIKEMVTSSRLTFRVRIELDNK